MGEKYEGLLAYYAADESAGGLLCQNAFWFLPHVGRKSGGWKGVFMSVSLLFYLQKGLCCGQAVIICLHLIATDVGKSTEDEIWDVKGWGIPSSSVPCRHF